MPPPSVDSGRHGSPGAMKKTNVKMTRIDYIPGRVLYKKVQLLGRNSSLPVHAFSKHCNAVRDSWKCALTDRSVTTVAHMCSKGGGLNVVWEVLPNQACMAHTSVQLTYSLAPLFFCRVDSPTVSSIYLKRGAFHVWFMAVPQGPV